MLFSELYSAYYNTVAAILTAAVDHPLQDKEFREIVEKYAFGESILNISPALKEGKWQLLKRDGSTPIHNVPTMPLTLLQKRWLKAIVQDPRIQLFGEEISGIDDVEPLFLPEDVFVFDQYSDGDDYEDEVYIRNFRLILDAIRNRYPLEITLENRRGNPDCRVVLPDYLEYSEKDDKFRLIGACSKFGSTVNLGRIISCSKYEKPFNIREGKRKQPRPRSVIFELTDRRNALERVLLHFAHFEKQAERLDGNRYRITIYYDKDDETEIVIRILSFGPMIKVTAPQHFIDLIKQRLLDQKSCGQ